MPFDPSTAQPAGGFDVSTAKPAFDPTTAQPAKHPFWADFGAATGGLVGLLKAPFTSSIPVELGKAAIKDPKTYILAGVPGLIYKKVEAFLAEGESKPLLQRMQDSFSDIKRTAIERPGLALGGLAHGVAADPELFFLPEMGAARAGATVADAAKTAGAGARTAQAAGAVAHGAANVAGSAAIGGGAELASELGEDRPFDPGAIGVSAAIGSLAAPLQAKLKGEKTKLTPAEIDDMLGPKMKPGAATTPRAEVHPTAEGYLVRMEGETEGRTFPTKQEAEDAKTEIEAQGSAYATMGVVPRGTQRSKLIFENPFTPENMRKWTERPKEDIAKVADSTLKFFGKLAVSTSIGAGIGAALDRDDPAMGAEFGAAISVIPRALSRLAPDKRISIAEVINARNGTLAVMARHTLQFKAAIDSAVPEPLRRSAISLALEKHEGITLNQTEQKVADTVRQHFDAMGQTAVDAGVIKEMLTDYVSHIVEEDPTFNRAERDTIGKIVDVLTGAERAGAPSGRQFAQHRRYATFDELQQALRGSGLKIKTGDVGEIMAIYTKAMFKAITDKRLIEALKVTSVEGMRPMVVPRESPPSRSSSAGGRTFDAEVKPGYVRLYRGESTKSLTRDQGMWFTPDKAVADHYATGKELTYIDIPAQELDQYRSDAAGTAYHLPAQVARGRKTAGGGFQLPPEPPPGESAQRFAARGPAMLLQPIDKVDSNYTVLPSRQLAGFAVHKDIAPQLNFVFSARDPNDVTLGLMALNQASKRAVVSFSLFHAKSLYDAFVGAMGLRAGTPNMAYRQAQKAVEMFKHGGSNEGIDDLLQHGLVLQMPEDAGKDVGTAALARIAGIVDLALPVSATGAAVKVVSKFNDLLDHFTFGTLQAGFKIITGLDAYERLIKKGLSREAAGKLAASYANDIYGSLDWFRVANDVGSRLGRDLVYGFFNPNGRRWAQLLMFAPDWTISTFRAAYKALPGAVDDGALAALHRRYLAKSAVYYLTVANAINLVTAGHSIFDNENPTRVQLKDGRTMQWSKHSMEPLEWMRDPIQTAANKLAFLPREAIQQITGKEYVSTHDSAPDIDNRAEHLARQFLPIMAQQGLAGGGATSAMGLFGMPVYGKDAEQKREARLAKKKADLEKRKHAAEYYKRLHQ